MKRITLILMFLMSCMIYLNGQSHISFNKQSYLFFGGSINSHNMMTTFGGTLGYSYKSKFDVGIRYKKGFALKMTDIYNVEQKSISPFFSIKAIEARPNGMPFSLRITGEVDAFKMKSTYSYTPFEANKHVFNLGANIFTNIRFVDGFGFHPNVSINYSKSVRRDIGYEQGQTTDSSLVSDFYYISFGIPMSQSGELGNTIVLAPTASFSVNGPMVNVQLNYMFTKFKE